MPIQVEDIWLDWQEEIANCPVQSIAVSGGLGAGKTNLIPKICYDQVDRYPGCRGAVAMPSYEQLDDSLHFEMENYFYKLRIKARYVAKERRWYFPNGSTIEYVSFNVPMEALKGPEYDFGIIDEGDNKMISREKYEAFDGRIGRSKNSVGSGKLWVFLNPVSHGHWAYQDFRAFGDPKSVLFEISTHQNRRFLRPGYIEKRERRYPPGTPGHDRWVLGKCGIPSERAVYKRFKYGRDSISVEEVAAKGGLRHFRSGLHLADGQPTGWLQVGFTSDGIMVPVRERKFEGESPDAVAKAIKAVRSPITLLKNEARADVLPKGFDPLTFAESNAVLADRSHKAFVMVSAAGLPLAVARSDESLGINKARNRIQRGKLKLLKLPDGRCATPEFLIELEEHQFSEGGELEKEKWSFVRPFEFMSVATASGIEQNHQANAGLRKALRGKPGKPFAVDSHRRAF